MLRVCWRPRDPRDPGTSRPASHSPIWDDEALATLEAPLAHTSPPVHVSSDYYYRMHARPIFRNYPVCAPGREPKGYWQWLQQREPEVVFDASRLKSEQDSIRAGELVFDAPILFENNVSAADVRNHEWWGQSKARLAKDGKLPHFR